jgi:hypothetical protein
MIDDPSPIILVGGDDRIRTGDGGFAGLTPTSIAVRSRPHTIEIAESFPD